MDDAQKEATPVRDQMEKGRLAIAEAVAAGSRRDRRRDQDLFRRGDADGRHRDDAFAKIFQGLDKDQQAKSPQIFGIFPGIFKNKNWNETPDLSRRRILQREGNASADGR